MGNFLGLQNHSFRLSKSLALKHKNKLRCQRIASKTPPPAAQNSRQRNPLTLDFSRYRLQDLQNRIFLTAFSTQEQRMRKRTTPGQLEFWATSSPAAATQEMLFTGDQLEGLAPKHKRLQVSVPDRHSKAPKQLDENFAQRRPLKILVADDNEINRKVIRIILQKLGYSCVEAENGEDALQMYQRGDYDYIFMDLDMPEMDGIETTQAIREAEGDGKRKTEIIAVTANVSQETRLKCRRVGMNGYLEKPITASIIKNQLLRSWPRVRTRRKD
ncbi:response regulator receiver domain protein [Verrucomicrobiia bacterium DG1235]|nr:response regulator receiver domain protein [Verrucomicrobiae bacterium DG1235]